MEICNSIKILEAIKSIRKVNYVPIYLQIKTTCSDHTICYTLCGKDQGISAKVNTLSGCIDTCFNVFYDIFLEALYNFDKLDTIDLTYDENENIVTLQQGEKEHKINCVPAEDIYALPSIPEGHNQKGSIILNTFLEGIKHVLYVVPNKEEPLYHAPLGALLEITPDKLCFAGTDGHSMLVYNDKMTYELDFAEVMPRPFLKLMHDTLKLYKDVHRVTVVLNKEKLAIWVYADDIILYSKLLENKFPNFRARLGVKTRFDIRINKKDLVKELKVFNKNKKYSSVYFDFRKDILNLSSEYTKYKTKLKCEIEISSEVSTIPRIELDAGYLLTGCKLDSDLWGFITFKFIDEKNPVFITGVNKDIIFVTMPMFTDKD